MRTGWDGPDPTGSPDTEPHQATDGNVPVVRDALQVALRTASTSVPDGPSAEDQLADQVCGVGLSEGSAWL